MNNIRPWERAWWNLRNWLCAHGLHWPIRFSDSAYPASYDPPHPPEPGWACDWCCYVRVPYRFWWLERTWWRLHAAWFEWRERRRPTSPMYDALDRQRTGTGWQPSDGVRYVGPDPEIEPIIAHNESTFGPGWPD